MNLWENCECIELDEEDALYQEIYEQNKLAEAENIEEVIVFQLEESKLEG